MKTSQFFTKYGSKCTRVVQLEYNYLLFFIPKSSFMYIKNRFAPLDSNYYEKLALTLIYNFHCEYINKMLSLKTRLVVVFQETARNHFWEAGMLMQSYKLYIIQ